jgi:SAM-dependent methyltransferase
VSELSEFKDRQRTMWATGDYHAVAHYIRDAGPDIVARLGVAQGEHVLDVACGTGNAAIPAALIGARVVGVDLTPELFVAARTAAAEAGTEVEWVQGDAEALPFDDASFDVVISTFGCMFAPRHSQAAEEIDRVLRPGGRLGLCNWRPDGTVGEFFGIIGSYVPPSPLVDGPPSLWGTEDHIHFLFADSDITFEFEHTQIEVEFESGEAMMELYETKFGPILAARAMLEPERRWPDLRADLVELFGRELDQNGMVPFEYLVVLGHKAG